MNNPKLLFVTSKISKTQWEKIQNISSKKILLLDSGAVAQFYNLENAPADVFFNENFLAAEDIDFLNKKTREILSQWYLPIKDKIIFDDILFSDLDFYKLYNEVLRRLRLVKILEKVKDESDDWEIVGSNKEFDPIIKSFFNGETPCNDMFSFRILTLKYFFYHSFKFCVSFFRKIILKEKQEAISANPYVFINFDINKFSSLWEYCAEKCRDKIILVAKSNKLFNKYKKLNFNSYLINHFFSFFCFGKSLKFLSRIFKHRNLIKENKVLFNINGFDMSEIFYKVLLKHIVHFYPQYIENTIAVNKFFDKHKSKGLFLWTDELWFEKICIAVARKKGAKSVVVQHGVSGGLLNNKPIYADTFAIWGNISKKNYIDMGIPEEKLKIIGSIQCDKAFKAKKEFDALGIRKKFGVAKDEYMVVFPILPLHKFRDKLNVKSDEALVLFNSVLAVASKYKNVKVVVKCRGEADKKVYEAWGKDKENIIYTCDNNLYALLIACDFVVSYYSTVALEAMLFDKLVVIANFSCEKEFVPYVTMGAALYAETKEELEKLFERILIGKEEFKEVKEKQKYFLEEYIYLRDGKAAERLIELVK